MRLTNLPLDVSPTSTVDLFIEGVAPALTGNQFTMKFLTSPVGIYDNVMILDDATYGRLDLGGLLAF